MLSCLFGQMSVVPGKWNSYIKDRALSLQMKWDQKWNHFWDPWNALKSPKRKKIMVGVA